MQLIAQDTSSTLRVSLTLPGFTIAFATQSVPWDLQLGCVSFALETASSMADAHYTGYADVASDGIACGTLYFDVQVGNSEQQQSVELPSKARSVRSVFASYATEDRIDVLTAAAAFEPLQIDVFVDILDIRGSEDWSARIQHEIASRDAFYLFWTKAASESPWVEREWRFALQTIGLERIYAVALSDVRDVPPPPELSSKHFASKAQMIRAYEKIRQQSITQP